MNSRDVPNFFSMGSYTSKPNTASKQIRDCYLRFVERKRADKIVGENKNKRVKLQENKADEVAPITAKVEAINEEKEAVPAKLEEESVGETTVSDQPSEEEKAEQIQSLLTKIEANATEFDAELFEAPLSPSDSDPNARSIYTANLPQDIQPSSILFFNHQPSPSSTFSSVSNASSTANSDISTMPFNPPSFPEVRIHFNFFTPIVPVYMRVPVPAVVLVGRPPHYYAQQFSALMMRASDSLSQVRLNQYGM